MRPIFTILTFVFLSSCSTNKTITNSDADKKAINNVLYQQQADWNSGDLTAFMQGYWKSDELSFIGSRGITKGWKATLDNYKKSYPTREIMGQLSFEIITLEFLAPDAARMVGRYTLIREKDKPTGLFTLIWRKINGKWLITSDQTC